MENAEKLLSAAESAMHSGHSPSDMSILISSEGRIRMVADSDWPLESLQSFHGAKTAYRLSHREQKVRIDGREGSRTCQFETQDARCAARSLLSGMPNYSVAGHLCARA